MAASGKFSAQKLRPERRAAGRTLVAPRSRRRAGLAACLPIAIHALASTASSGSTNLDAAFVGVHRSSRVARDFGTAAGPSSRSLGLPAQPRSVARRSWETFEEFARDPVVSCVGWTVVLASLAIVRVAVMADETDTPSAFLKSSKKEPAPAVAPPVICLGDSLTRGNLSADWVGSLRQNLMDKLGEPAVVLNAGVNMQCASNVRKRLDEVIACKPSHVTVLVGTNDLKAGHSEVEGLMYKVFGKLPKVPTLDDYRTDLVEIRDRLLEAGACVALVSPPVLGEDINSPENQRAAAMAATVQHVASEGGGRCAYLPLFERTSEKLPKVGGKPYDGLRFFWWLCLLCFDIHLLKRDLTEVQRERNLGVTLDLVHLGPASANALAEMTASFIAAFPARRSSVVLSA
mmetsp:Transcript_9096/g.20707  ORF Transcript_9096/g.20707 Transcript_9096/m.20707 type:complete len:403 (-) Transcript_9096:140-1348(-)|eukprot:CAMPEP_0197916054 /NCGR_PEP_ID=MMETSP1439-20131203/81285_1 /TAXON_ID=66791 /ORGANISM="Gonyaulax spinifera, Strain CCMP409" /LENGTH=402 /DNA_ID=CAMNT_0043538047 /DNA_START=46 /DNA_END=1254 /DNA_ORIENTATION=-